MIRIDDLHVRYRSDEADVHAVRGVSINVREGEFYTLLGPSGCGKTTTLRCVAGLETPSGGEIAIADTVVYSARSGAFLPAHRRDIGMVFQSYAIWPHMTVAENVAFPLQEMRTRPDRVEIARQVREALALVQLQGYEERPAPFLSGGQQQRLALARALVRRPKVLLLDEPLSNLDAKLREETRAELRDLVKRLNITTIYVTHDQLEALTMSDRVAVMETGRIVQEASPRAIYREPVSRFVASFIGRSNFVDGTVRAGAGPDGIGVIDTPCGMLRGHFPADADQGASVTVAVRPENIHLADARTADANLLDGKVNGLLFLGDALECHVTVGAAQLSLRLHAASEVVVGQELRLAIAVHDVIALTR
jgi:iron(III) transport system ATP-binding protein